MKLHRSAFSKRRMFTAGTMSAALIATSFLTTIGNPASAASNKPILVGVSLSLTGDFSADGIAFKQGYELWAKDTNAKGGLITRN
jgi:branched-chain amino acid transport system substrate-binding protein